jgi:hypothetical protein
MGAANQGRAIDVRYLRLGLPGRQGHPNHSNGARVGESVTVPCTDRTHFSAAGNHGHPGAPLESWSGLDRTLRPPSLISQRIDHPLFEPGGRLDVREYLDELGSRGGQRGYVVPAGDAR